jgi:hypothetical protein
LAGTTAAVVGPPPFFTCGGPWCGALLLEGAWQPRPRPAQGARARSVCQPGRAGPWGGGQEEVRAAAWRVKEVAQNEEARRAGWLRLQKSAEELRCLDPAPRARVLRSAPWRRSPAPCPASPGTGRCGLATSRAARPGALGERGTIRGAHAFPGLWWLAPGQVAFASWR